MPHFDDKQYSSFLRMMKNLCKDFPGSFICRTPFHGATRETWDPPVDIYETEDAVIIRLEVAGIHREDFDIKYLENKLHISGSRHEHEVEKKTRVHQMELHYGSFEKVIGNIPPVDEEKLSASYDNGFLTVILPKIPGGGDIEIKKE